MDWNRKNNREILREAAIPTAEGSFPLLKFPILDETGLVEHCFTTRYGGVSEGEFSSLNLSYTRGDDKAAVDENFRRLANAIGVTVNDFVFSDQTHTTNVLRVGKEDRGSGIMRPRPYHDVDGLITDEPQVVLATFFADCVPLYFVDVKRKAIGMSHSGWRGTVGRMGAKTLEAMAREFGTDPADVVAAVGPSICRDCYEISDDVAKVFMETFPAQHHAFLEEKGGGKYQLDLWKCNELILLDAGILPEHLAVTDICTCCNPTHLFSHRASKGRRGNLGAFLYLKAEK
jgi:hypothetical protein